MRVLDLFSGLGLISLGLHWAGYQTVGLCEVDEWCRSELARNFPGVWIHDDVRTLTADLVRRHCGPIDLIAGGFPCQPVSVAGRRQGEADSRWLWPEFARLIGDIRPAWVLAENVPGLRTHGADRVLADLEGQGYTGWPVVVGADDVGAPHRRKRVWIVAHAKSGGCRGRDSLEHGERQPDSTHPSGEGNVANATGQSGDSGQQESIGQSQGRTAADRAGTTVGDTSGLRCGQGWQPTTESARGLGCPGEGVADTGSQRLQVDGTTERGEQLTADARNRWPSRPGEPQHPWEPPRLLESGLGCGPHGLARELARKRKRQLKGLGNSVVPQVVTAIGRAIKSIDTGLNTNVGSG